MDKSPKAQTPFDKLMALLSQTEKERLLCVMLTADNFPVRAELGTFHGYLFALAYPKWTD